MSLAIRPRNVTIPLEAATVRIFEQPRIEFIETAGISDTAVDQLYALYTPHHDTAESDFRDRLYDELDMVAVFRDAADCRIVGFTGLRLRRFELSDGSTAATIYMGLTFIEAAWRGHLLVQRMVLRMFLELRWLHPREPIYVWSEAATVRPYLLAARYLTDYYPSPFCQTPPQVEELRQLLGQTYHSDDFAPQSGVVRGVGSNLDRSERTIQEDSLDDPHVRFYMKHNPGYVDGDGLLIVQPASFRNARYFLGLLGRRKLSNLMANISLRPLSVARLGFGKARREGRKDQPRG